jgi:hypothetical protein
MPQKKERPVTCFDLTSGEGIGPQVNEEKSTRAIHSTDTQTTQKRGFGAGTDPPASPKKRKAPHDQPLLGKIKSNKRIFERIKHKSPWGSFKKVYECDLAGEGVVVVMKSRHQWMYFLKTFPGNELDELLHTLYFT